MATPSCSEVLVLALLAVSSVSVFHTVGRPIIPDHRPLNCAFCLTLWFSLALAANQWTLEAVWAIPVAGFFALVAAGQWPWAFYSAPVLAEPAVPVAEANQPGKV